MGGASSGGRPRSGPPGQGVSPACVTPSRIDAHGISGGEVNVDVTLMGRPSAVIDAAAASRMSTTWACFVAVPDYGLPGQEPVKSPTR